MASPLVEPQALAAVLDDPSLRLLDARPAADFAAGHLPAPCISTSSASA